MEQLQSTLSNTELEPNHLLALELLNTKNSHSSVSAKSWLDTLYQPISSIQDNRFSDSTQSSNIEQKEGNTQSRKQQSTQLKTIHSDESEDQNHVDYREEKSTKIKQNLQISQENKVKEQSKDEDHFKKKSTNVTIQTDALLAKKSKLKHTDNQELVISKKSASQFITDKNEAKHVYNHKLVTSKKSASQFITDKIKRHFLKESIIQSDKNTLDSEKLKAHLHKSKNRKSILSQSKIDVVNTSRKTPSELLIQTHFADNIFYHQGEVELLQQNQLTALKEVASERLQMYRNLIQKAIMQIGERGIATATVRMIPSHLGNLTMNLHIQGTHVNASFVVENKMAQDLLMNDLNGIRDELAQQKISVEHIRFQIRSSISDEPNLWQDDATNQNHHSMFSYFEDQETSSEDSTPIFIDVDPDNYDTEHQQSLNALASQDLFMDLQLSYGIEKNVTLLEWNVDIVG